MKLIVRKISHYIKDREYAHIMVNGIVIDKIKALPINYNPRAHDDGLTPFVRCMRHLIWEVDNI